MDLNSFKSAIRVVMLPRDTNQYGSIFGGVILSYIDQAAFVEAMQHGIHRWVTASFEKVDFKKPIYVGDLVSFSTRTLKTGTKSVTIEVKVESTRSENHETVEVTTATVTMVSIGPDGKSIPFSTPATAHYRSS
jgi:acyl-CoA thioesterase YciA